MGRQRQLDGDDSQVQPAKRARLTEPNTALRHRASRKNGTKMTDSTSSSSDSEPTAKSTSTVSIASTGFAIQAQRNGILHQAHSKPPTSLEERRESLARSRQTPSPPASVYERYISTVLKASNEATMAFEVGSQLLKTHDDSGYPRVFNRAFTAFPDDAGFNNGLSAPQPGFVEGLELREYQPFPVDELVCGAVLFQDDPFSVTLPHIAGEWKARGKDSDEARTQSAYHGAALVYARNKTLAYLGNPDPEGYAQVTTFTTDGSTINFFAHYAAQSESGALEYHQYPIASTNLTSSFEEFSRGRRQLRNLQEDARAYSCALRDQLKGNWNTTQTPNPSTGLSACVDGARPKGPSEFGHRPQGPNGHHARSPPALPAPAPAAALQPYPAHLLGQFGNSVPIPFGEPSLEPARLQEPDHSSNMKTAPAKARPPPVDDDDAEERTAKKQRVMSGERAAGELPKRNMHHNSMYSYP